MHDVLRELTNGELNVDAKGGAGRRLFYAFIVVGVYPEYRRIELKEVDEAGESGWSTMVNLPEGFEAKRGDVALVGIDGFNSIGFVLLNGTVLVNKSQEDYEAESASLTKAFEDMVDALLAENRELWEAVESYLSEPVRERIQYFRDHAEGDFEREGWGYEVAIGELVDLLVDSNLAEDETVTSSLVYSECSGNQFSVAKALASDILEGKSIKGTLAGLSPLTGKAFY